VASSRVNFTFGEKCLNKTVFVFSVKTVCLVHMWCFYCSVINTLPHRSFTVSGGNTSALVHTASSHFTSAPRSKQEIRHSPMYEISATIIFWVLCKFKWVYIYVVHTEQTGVRILTC